MLHLLYSILTLRWTVSAAFMLGTAPSYFFIWVLWRLATLLLSNRVYEMGDDFLWGFYQRLVLFFFEHCTKLKVILYGDAEEVFKKKENCILICNHQCTVDWLIADVLTVRQGTIGKLRYILKDALKWLPLYGFYFRQHSCIYVKRAGKFEEEKARYHLDLVARNDTSYVMVIFPEGTRYNVNLPNVIQRSRQYAIDNGLPPLKHMLMPRTRAFELCIQHLRDKTAAIYDLTIGYANTVHPVSGQRLSAPGLAEFLQSSGQELHLHLKRTDIKDVPKDEVLLKKWLNDQFVEKDRLLETFFAKPNNDKSASARGEGAAVEQSFGPGGRRNVLPLSETVPALIFFLVLNGLLFLTHFGRALYLNCALFGTIVCWIFIAIKML